MIKPRLVIRFLLGIALCAVVSPFPSGGSMAARAQQQATAATTPDDLTRGLDLYKQGDDKGSIEVLRRVVKKNKNEVGAWYVLALAYTRQGKMGDARKAHEKAALGGEWLLEQIYSTFSYEDVPAATEKYKALLLMAADSSRKYLELTSKPSVSKAEEWNDRADMLRDYAALSEERGSNPALSKIYSSRDVETKTRIISRPEPQYTERARRNGVTGTVVIRAIFAFDGRVKAIRVVKGLPDGLNFSAIRAARRIRFVPASVNGKPVSQYIQIEYNFNLY